MYLPAEGNCIARRAVTWLTASGHGATRSQVQVGQLGQFPPETARRDSHAALEQSLAGQRLGPGPEVIYMCKLHAHKSLCRVFPTY